MPKTSKRPLPDGKKSRTRAGTRAQKGRPKSYYGIYRPSFGAEILRVDAASSTNIRTFKRNTRRMCGLFEPFSRFRFRTPVLKQNRITYVLRVDSFHPQRNRDKRSVNYTNSRDTTSFKLASDTDKTFVEDYTCTFSESFMCVRLR